MDTGKIKLNEFQITEEFENLSTRSKKRSKQGRLEIVSMDNENLELDFIGFHTTLINAYRRIILAEVPTMTVEKVHLYNNTSIVQDEVLAHRIGLVPLKADPHFFEFPNSADETEWGPQDSVKYELKVKCSRNPKCDAEETDLDLKYLNRKVTSSSLKWVAIGNQLDIFQPSGMEPLHSDILLAKLNPGHEINLEAYAIKGIGSDHAKFQPGLCWYRMMPEIQLTREVEGNDAQLLQKCFSQGVIALTANKEGKLVARVKNARNDLCSRNVFQYESIKDAVKLTRKTDHIIFYVESHCTLKSYEILEDAIGIMISKCDALLSELDTYLNPSEDD